MKRIKGILVPAILILAGCQDPNLVEYRGEEYHVNEIVALLESAEREWRASSARCEDDLKRLADENAKAYESGIQEGRRRCQN